MDMREVVRRQSADLIGELKNGQHKLCSKCIQMGFLIAATAQLFSVAKLETAKDDEERDNFLKMFAMLLPKMHQLLEDADFDGMEKLLTGMNQEISDEFLVKYLQPVGDFVSDPANQPPKNRPQ